MNKADEALRLLDKSAEWFPENDLVKRLRGKSHSFGKFIDALDMVTV